MAGVWIRRTPVQEPFDANVLQVKSECPVCYEVFVDSPTTSSTASCGHKTCRPCFQEILKSTMACPICRCLLLTEKADICFPSSKMLNLFILNPSFFAVPGSTILLRVFEPRYLMLVKRCIETDTVFGLQAGFIAQRGVLVYIRRHRELPEGHIIIEGIAVGRYEAFDGASTPSEEPETFGLYRMKSKILLDVFAGPNDGETIQLLTKQADDLLKARVNDMSKYEKDVLLKICGPCPSAATTEFSYWLLGALHSPVVPKPTVLYSTCLADRIKFCIKLLEEDQPFECLIEEAATEPSKQ